MKIGKNNCNKSKKQRPCIYDLVNYVKLDNPDCLISPNGNHSWSFSQNLSFRQHWKHQEIRDLQCCDYCTTTREVSYMRDVGYNPHRG